MVEQQFKRKDLRDSLIFTELNYSNVDPRRLYRRLRKEIEEVQTGEAFKYSIDEWGDPNPEISPESIGTQNGRVAGGATVNTSGWQEFSAEQETESGTGTIVAGVTAVVGILSFFGGFALQGGARAIAVGLGLVLLVVAGVIYYSASPSTKERAFLYRKQSHILLKGEVSEKETDTDQSVIESEDLDVYIGETLQIKRKTSEGENRLGLDDLPEEKYRQLTTALTPLPEEIPQLDETEKVGIERRVS